jgi:hypothetical protein
MTSAYEDLRGNARSVCEQTRLEFSVMRWRTLAVSALLIAFTPLTSAAAAAGSTWKAGAAKVKITPRQSMWMSGYAARTMPSQGTLNDLWAKALVLEDPRGRRVVLVTMDLVGIDRATSVNVRDRVQQKHKLDRADVALCCSHTHSGPVVGHNLHAMYALGDEQAKRVSDYTKDLEDKLVAVVDEAFGKLAPAKLEWGVGSAGFAVNRRNNSEPDVARLRAAGQEPKGPSDHDLPVLAVKGATDGKLLAVAFGYACHATTLDGYQWSGDWPGFAQDEWEQSHGGGAVALLWAGCGADQTPIPRRTVELPKQYGHAAAAGVDAVLSGSMKPLDGGGAIASSYDEIDLPLDKLPTTREQLVEETKSTNVYTARRAAKLLETWDRDGKLQPTYPYPVQVWRLGPDLKWVLLGGEVVVDYSLRLKKELGPGTTWVAGYANDVMAYIPSLRVLKEGGYEGGGAMVYYGLPGVWGPEVEERIVKEVRRQMQNAE